MAPFNRLTIVAAALLFLCAAAGAQDLPSSPESAQSGAWRLCTREDLVGHTFQMVDFLETPPRGETQFIKMFSYDYLSFSPSGHFNALAIDSQVRTIGQLRNYMRGLPADRRVFTLSKDGVLLLVRNDKIQYTYRCIAVLKANSDYAVGDLVLTGYTKRHKSELYKLYRRRY